MTEREEIRQDVNKALNHLIVVILHSLHHFATNKDDIKLLGEILKQVSKTGVYFDNHISTYVIDPKGQDRYKTDRWSPRTIKEDIYTNTPFFNRKATESHRHPYECDRQKGIHKPQHTYMIECYVIYSYTLLSQEQEE